MAIASWLLLGQGTQHAEFNCCVSYRNDTFYFWFGHVCVEKARRRPAEGSARVAAPQGGCGDGEDRALEHKHRAFAALWFSIDFFSSREPVYCLLKEHYCGPPTAKLRFGGISFVSWPEEIQASVALTIRFG